MGKDVPVLNYDKTPRDYYWVIPRKLWTPADRKYYESLVCARCKGKIEMGHKYVYDNAGKHQHLNCPAVPNIPTS